MTFCDLLSLWRVLMIILWTMVKSAVFPIIVVSKNKRYPEFLLYGWSVTVHGFPVPSSPCLVCVRVRMREQVSVGVCDWGWFAPAESHHRWAISVPVTLSPLSDPCSVCGRRLRSVLVPRFLSPAASWTPIAGPWLPIASLRYPPLPYGKLRFCLRKAPLLPTESSASALRKAQFLPMESSASAYEELHFSFSLCITSCNKLSFRNWILPFSLWHDHL